MPIYTTTFDCSRALYFSTKEKISNIDVVFEKSVFDVSISYQWSYDNSTFTDKLDKESFLLSIADSEFIDVTMYIRITISLTTSLRSQSMKYFELNNIIINNADRFPESIEILQANSILTTTNSTNLFNPYRNVDNQKQLYAKLSKSISDMFGFECIWFKSEPDEESADVTFKTYRLSNVVKYDNVKIVIKDNELPDNRLKFAEFDVDFQDEIEIHIVKEVFHEVFETEPNSNDYIYLPLTDRMYQINTVYEAKEFMNYATYYSAILVKYEKKSSVINNIDADEYVDELIDFDVDFNTEQYENEKSDATNEYNDVKTDTALPIHDDSVKVDGLEIFRYSYDHLSINKTSIAHVYDVGAIKKPEWSLSFWLHKEINGQICKLTNVLEGVAMTLEYTNKSFKLVAKCENVPTTLTTIADDMFDDSQFHAIVINFVHELGRKMITLSILNEKLEVIQEIASMNVNVLQYPTKIHMYGAQKIANIRVWKTFIGKSIMQAKVSDMFPKSSDCYLIDNATPEYTEPTQTTK